MFLPLNHDNTVWFSSAMLKILKFYFLLILITFLSHILNEESTGPEELSSISPVRMGELSVDGAGTLTP